MHYCELILVNHCTNKTLNRKEQLGETEGHLFDKRFRDAPCPACLRAGSNADKLTVTIGDIDGMTTV